MVAVAVVIILIMVGSGSNGVNMCVGVCVYESEFLLSRQGNGKPSNSD